MNAVGGETNNRFHIVKSQKITKWSWYKRHIGPTFRAEIRISCREPARSFFEDEQSNKEFESRMAQYCSSCMMDNCTGTQYSLSLEESGLQPFAMYWDSLSLKMPVLWLESITKHSLPSGSLWWTSRDSKCSVMPSCKSSAWMLWKQE